MANLLIEIKKFFQLFLLHQENDCLIFLFHIQSFS